MALTKQPVNINFRRGLDTKGDPYQVQVGSFLTLVNSVFTETGRLTKRNGFKNITNLPNQDQTSLTTLNDNLIATGSNLYSYSKSNKSWLDKGIVQPVQLEVQPLIRASTSQSAADTAIAANGLVCLTYIDNGVAYYQISDSTTGEQIVSRTALESTALNPRVFLLKNYFILTYVITGTPTLKYVAIPTASPSIPKAPGTISASLSSANAGYDGFVVNDTLYMAWGGSASSVRIAYLTFSLAISAESVIPASAADLMSVTADVANQMVWISYWDTTSNDGYSAAFNYILGPLVAPTQIINNLELTELTSVARNRQTNVFYQNVNNYSYMDGANAIRSDFISEVVVTAPVTGTGAGTVTGPDVVLRSVGLASKAFIGVDDTIYMMAVYGDLNQVAAVDNSNQATYFLINESGDIYMRLAYANGGGYLQTQVLPSVNSMDGTYSVPYQLADFLATVNKGTSLPANTPVNALYTQYGINLAMFTINDIGQHSFEIAGALHLTGGQLWEYDGVRPIEHGFQVWPENIIATTSGTGGLITAQTYFYVFTYEWTDNQGNLHRSAPSIPFKITTSGATSTNTINVPTLRLTYKVAPNPVRIVGYRWSTAQPVYYQFTSITSPVVNSTTTDSVTITDIKADSAILGQTILYTTGGVVEDIAAPASIASALFDNRAWLIDAEDPNLLWYSKQVIENVPVEFSDLLTLYVAPTTGAQASTGPSKALGAMDDKLVIFKKDAIYYINGTGPDNTGANSSYSQPIFITATVGCANPNSIVLIPNGMLFQSDKGIWMLGRDLSTQYIGAPVELYNDNVVVSANAIPGTNQVRFTLDNNITLMYDYFFNEWGTHTNVNSISSTLYQGMHTYLNSFGQVFQETANTYTDGSTPVLMSFTTSWINLAGLQGYERFYQAYFLGTYYTPFMLDVQLAYDYNPSATQSIKILPDNYSAKWGGESLWGGGQAWGGPGNVFEARAFPEIQKCESFQVSIQEVYDPSLGQAPGQGLSLSGLNLVVGLKKGYRVQKASQSFG